MRLLPMRLHGLDSHMFQVAMMHLRSLSALSWANRCAGSDEGGSLGGQGLNGQSLSGRSRKLILTVSFGSLVAGAQALYSGSASGDDTFIFMRYVDNFLRGRGYCFNPGEKVLGVTSPLWAFVMTPIAVAFGNTEAVWKAVSAALVGVRASVLILLCLGVGLRAGMAAVVALVAMADPHAIRWGGSGMEHLLALLLLTVAVLQYWQAVQQPTDARFLQLGLTCGLLPFARPEFSVFVGVLAVATLLQVRDRRSVAACLCGGLLTGSLAATMTWLEFGALVPQTAIAKALLLSQADPLYASKSVLRILASGAGPAALAFLLAWRRVKALAGLSVSVFALAVVTSR